MSIIDGFSYNFKGLLLGIKTPKLLFLGLVRFLLVIIITFVAASLILIYYQEILTLIWAKPESKFIIWLWYLVSWLVAIVLVGFSAVVSYLFSQIIFGVVIMDKMSRITEGMATGQVVEPEKLPFFKLFLYLIGQEMPRSIVPIFISIVVMVLGWFVALGPILVLLASGVTIIFLSWDNTDLVPARRMIPFKKRFKMLSKTLSFHLGFGLPFLIPGLNILLLSFAPVGATLYFIEKKKDVPVSS